MHRVVASWFGSGLLPRALFGRDLGPGTIGSLLAFAMAWAIGPDRWPWQVVAVVVTAGLSLWSSRPFAEHDEDPGWIVVDEAAGMFLATVGLAIGPALAALVVFRIADATKRFPGVAAAERLHGAVGITADDLVAGAYGLAAGWAVQAWLG